MAKSELYKGVYHAYKKHGKEDERWRCVLDGLTTYHNTEREAAIAFDKKLINKGKEPVNVLIRK